MSAKVRIAPMERWCHFLLEKVVINPSYLNLPGMEIEILADSMVTAVNTEGKPFNKWLATEESVRRMDEVSGAGGPTQGIYLCEHFLEMD